MVKRIKVSPDNTIIKKLKGGDLDQAVPIYLDSFTGMRDPKSIKQWLQCSLRAFPQKICFGVWCNDSLLGYIVWAEKGTFRSEAIWELEQIAVLSAYRRKGIGEKLISDSLSEVKAHLKKRNANLKLIKVTTGIDNESALLYEKVLGAKRECVIADFYSGDEQVMIARCHGSGAELSDEDRTLLRLEYQECQEGYNNRDRVIPQELSYIGIVFGVLTTALLFAIRLLPADSAPFYLVLTVIGVLGLCFILGFLVDILANASSKRALRQRSMQIEELLYPSTDGLRQNTPLQIWRNAIPERNRGRGERFLKGVIYTRLTEREVNYFMLAGWLSLVLWIALVVFCAIYGPQFVSADSSILPQPQPK